MYVCVSLFRLFVICFICSVIYSFRSFVHSVVRSLCSSLGMSFYSYLGVLSFVPYLCLYLFLSLFQHVFLPLCVISSIRSSCCCVSSFMYVLIYLLWVFGSYFSIAFFRCLVLSFVILYFMMSLVIYSRCLSLFRPVCLYLFSSFFMYLCRFIFISLVIPLFLS